MFVLSSPHANFHNDRTMWSVTLLVEKIAGGAERKISPTRNLNLIKLTLPPHFALHPHLLKPPPPPQSPPPPLPNVYPYAHPHVY